MGTFRETHIVQWLLENTEKPNGFKWQSRELSGMYFADIGEGKNLVQISVGLVQCRPAVRIVLKFTSPGLGDIYIQEPLQSIFPFFSRNKYDSEEENDLAEALKHLLNVVSGWVAQRQLRDIETEEERKQLIFNRLMGGNPDK